MIREATSADTPAIARLINAAFVVEQFFIDGDRITEAEVARLLTRGAFLVDADAATPFAGVVYLEPRGDRAYLGLLSIDPALQGRGLGAAMVHAAEAWCRARGVRAIDIRVVNLRTELFPFYERLGYVRTGTAPFPTETPTRLPCEFVEMTKEL